MNKRFEDLSAEWIALITNISIQSVYNKFWRGRTEPTMSEIIDISHALGIRYDECIHQIKEALDNRRNKYGNI